MNNHGIKIYYKYGPLHLNIIIGNIYCQITYIKVIYITTISSILLLLPG